MNTLDSISQPPWYVQNSITLGRNEGLQGKARVHLTQLKSAKKTGYASRWSSGGFVSIVNAELQSVS